MSRQVLAIVGSPRHRGTSASLARTVVGALELRGWESCTVQASTALRDPERWSELERRFLAADAVLLSLPLYVDSLPSELTLALERLAPLRAERGVAHRARLLAVVQCGFVEAHQNDVAVEICRHFAREAGLAWAGGLAIGAGGMANGADVRRGGARLRHVKRALELAASALDSETDVPEEALVAGREPGVPRWAYTLMANLSMVFEARRRGVLLRLHAQPYRRAES
jgi:multimeric flavodoxin WrbA